MLKNQLLQQALEKVQESVQDRSAFDKLVKAGTKVIYSEGTFQELAKLMRDSKDPAGDVARGMVAVLQLMAHQARGTIPHDALLQAGMALVIDALDFIEQAGLVKVDAKVLDEATQQYIEALLPSVGLTQETMDSTLDQIQQVVGDPQKMAEYKASLGGTK